MVFQNLGFEDEDPAEPGQAEDWTAVTTENAEEAAAFDDGQTPPILGRPVDAFEGGWGNADFIGKFDDPVDLNQIFPAIFTEPPDTDRETFEAGWDGNSGFNFELSSVEAALFNMTNDPEDAFEREWDGVEFFEFVMGATDAAKFDSTFETVEDYEEEWNDNENFDFSFVGVVHDFHSISGQEEEDFEVAKAEIVITVDPVTDEINASAHGFSVGENVTFRNENGQLPLGIQPDTVYKVKTVPDANTITIAQTAVAPVLDLTDFGTGTHFINGDPKFVWVGTEFMKTL